MLIEHEVGERVRVPLVVALSTEVENLHVELSGGVDSTIIRIQDLSQLPCTPDSQMQALSSRDRCLHNVTVDHLNENHSSVVSHDVEGLGLDIGVRVCAPAQNLLVHVGERGGLGLLRHRLDSLWAIDRLLGAHDGRETVRIESVKAGEDRITRNVRRLEPVHDFDG